MITKEQFIEECRRLGMEYHHSKIGSGGWVSITDFPEDEICEWSSSRDKPLIFDLTDTRLWQTDNGWRIAGPLDVLESVEELRQYYNDLLTKMKEQKRTMRRKLIEEL